ncbi:MAG: ATP-binding protein [Peptococcaceae bacterium]|nr:ATP-binding protein [Peptococcaceae bacterium]
MDSMVIFEEYLYCYPNGRRVVIFKREDINRYRLTRNNDEQKALSRRTMDNKLYLTTSAGWNYHETIKMLEWFKTASVIGDFTNLANEFQWNNHAGELFIKDPEMRHRIARFMTIADVCVTDLAAKVLSADEFTKDIPETLKKMMTNSNIRRFDVKMGHMARNAHNKANTVFLDQRAESGGTIKLLILSGQWIEALERDPVLVIDELDSSLHPAILDKLLSQFHSNGTNKGNAQLIFTTHNMHLLTLDNLRRDQIWFAEKDPDSGSTDLFSLAEIKGVRKDENVAKVYINRRYGAVPFLSGWVE